MMRIKKIDEFGHNYYQIKGINNRSIFCELLPYVADLITAEGIIYEENDWKALLVNPENIERVKQNE